MEMPINVMVVLFVALAVAGGVLMFSSDIFTSSRQSLHNVVPREDDQRIVDIEGGEINSGTVAYLVDQCWSDKEFGGTPDRELCFIVHGSKVTAASAEVAAASEIAKTDSTKLKWSVASPQSLNSLAIYYDPSGFIEVKP